MAPGSAAGSWVRGGSLSPAATSPRSRWGLPRGSQQASFAPPLVVLGAKADNPSTAMIESSGLFNINVLETGQVAHEGPASSLLSDPRVVEAYLGLD